MIDYEIDGKSVEKSWFSRYFPLSSLSNHFLPSSYYWLDHVYRMLSDSYISTNFPQLLAMKKEDL